MTAARGPRDVRMRGFRDRADVERVVAWVDALPVRAPAEEVPLAEASGRVLAEDVTSDVDVPPFRRAAMDGWALRAEDTFGASEGDPVALRVVGRALPGAPPALAVGRGEAVRIMTGAPVPPGADAVLPAEEGEERDGTLLARAALPGARNVGDVGEDVRAGQVVLARGRRLRPQDLGLAASVGRAAVRAVARPRVRLLVTGDELLPVGSRPDATRIVDANSPMLAALVRRDGGTPVQGPLLRDDRDALRGALLAAGEDVLLVSGGSSVGEEDHAPRLLEELGFLAFHGVSMRPSSPAGAGLLAERPVFLLPGNPVSCLCAYDFFAGRAVRRLAGLPAAWPYRSVRLPLARKVSSALGRLDYVRVAVRDGRAEPLMSRGASILSSTTEADGFVVVPKGSEGHPAGAPVVVHLYDDVAAGGGAGEAASAR
jgi:molybdopterin molybdotransferase